MLMKGVGVELKRKKHKLAAKPGRILEQTVHQVCKTATQ